MAKIGRTLSYINTSPRPESSKGQTEQNQAHGSSRPGNGGSSSLPGNLSDYLLKSIWDRVWEIKTDNQGNEYIFGKLPVVTQYGITMYADGGELNLPSIYAGIPFDNKTIWLNPETKKVEVIGGTGGGVADSVHWKNIEGKPSFSAVATSGKYADLSGLPDLSVYATTKNLTDELKKYVTLNTEQNIDAHKNFLAGLSIGGLPITKSQDDVIYLDANLVVRGGITMFGINSVDVPTIMDAIATDEVNLKVVDGVLTFVGSTGGGLTEVYWDDVIGRPTLLSSFIDDFVQYNYLPLSGGQITGRVEFKTNSIYGVEINRLDSKSPVIHFCCDGNSYGYIGFDRANTPTYYDNGFRPYEILHTGNWTKYISAGGIGAYLPQSGGNMSGHIFMTGAVADSSTANTSQLVFGTSANNHVCLSSNMKGLVINPSLDDTSGQIALYADINMESFIQSSLKVYGSLYASVYFNYAGSIAQSYGSSMYVWDNNLQINKTTSGHDYLKTIMSFDLINEDIEININGTLSLNSYILWNSDSNNPYMGIVYSGRDWYLQAYNNNYIYLGTGIATSIRIDTAGNLLTAGGITMYSDKRKKTILNHVELTLQQIADAPLIEHYYNSDTNKTTHVGSIAQYWASMNDWFCKLDSEGFYTMEIQNAALASAISIARELVRYESKTDKEIRLLKDEVKRLKKEIKILKSA